MVACRVCASGSLAVTSFFQKGVVLSKGHAGRRPFYGCINRSIDLVGSQRESPLPLITRQYDVRFGREFDLDQKALLNLDCGAQGTSSELIFPELIPLLPSGSKLELRCTVVLHGLSWRSTNNSITTWTMTSVARY